MVVTGILLCAFFTTCVCASGVADVVLSCEFIEDSVGPHDNFARSPATLILREVFVGSLESLEALNPFVPPSNPDPLVIMFESKGPPTPPHPAFYPQINGTPALTVPPPCVTVSSFKIPNVHILLHADCNEREVMCEINRYAPHGLKESSGSDHFLVSIDVEGGAFGTLLILRAVPQDDDQTSRMHPELGLPLSQTGTMLTEVLFLVFSTVKSLSAPLRGAGLLNCGFRHQGMSPDEEVHIEWRQIHHGRGKIIITTATRLNDPEGGAMVQHWSKDSSMDGTQVVSEGNASVTLNNFQVTDEGAYICSVTIGPYHGQQVVNLQVVQAPSVSFSEEKLVLKGNAAQTLRCQCSQYYPLDVQVEWLSQSPTDEEPAVFADQGSLSSHWKHGDGTYSLSSHLVVPPDVVPGTRITCRVSHVALDAPVSVSVLVEHLEEDYYWWVLSFLGITVVFFYQVIK